ncbi:hypothetical protein [Haloarchaeobius sp. TZWWS8]|uniref:DUF7827 domain-containing protein n=1 Tax=Haloarchaeobius sp. TZWWS8 TaxID=3446121 RepID=UPI003EBC7DB7
MWELATGARAMVIIACAIAVVAAVSAGAAAASDEPVAFWSVPETVVDQPGDPVRLPVELGPNDSRATVTIANDSIGYRLDVTVADRDGDGRVGLCWNTHYAGVVADGELERVVSAEGEDRVVAATRTSERRSEHLPAGRYSVAVGPGDRPVEDGESPVASGTVVLEVDLLRAQSMRVLEGPADLNASAAYEVASTSSRIERDEWLFVEVNDTSIHGYIETTSALVDPGTEGVSMHIQRTHGGPAVPVTDATFLHYPERDVFVLAFKPNTTRFEANAIYRATFTVAESNPYAVAQERVMQDFTILPGGSEDDGASVEVVEVDAPERVIEGRDANFTVAVVNSGSRAGNVTIRVTLDDQTVSRTVVVFPHSRLLVTIPVNTAPLTEGKSHYTVRVEGGSRVQQGFVDVWLSDDPPNTYPTFAPRESAGQPGFGVLAALVAVSLWLTGVRRRR